MHSNAHNPTITIVKLLSDFSITNDTPYHARDFLKKCDHEISRAERTVFAITYWQKSDRSCVELESFLANYKNLHIVQKDIDRAENVYFFIVGTSVYIYVYISLNIS